MLIPYIADSIDLATTQISVLVDTRWSCSEHYDKQFRLYEKFKTIIIIYTNNIWGCELRMNEAPAKLTIMFTIRRRLAHVEWKIHNLPSQDQFMLRCTTYR